MARTNLAPVLSVLPPMRTWQQEALDESHDILIVQDKPHMYVCAPTASGKSRFMFELCERLPLAGVRVIVVGLKQICTQLRDGFRDDYGCTEHPDDAGWFISPSGQQIFITTYQGLTAIAKRLNSDGVDPLWETAALIFDEIHVGGSNSGNRTGDEDFAEQSSVQRIFSVFAPQKRVYVSATTQTADETILGPKRDHFYRYSLSQAYRDGILNPVDMIEVHTGTTLKIKQAEDHFGRNIEELETLSHDDLQALSQEMGKRSIALNDEAVTGVRWLVRNRHIEMIKLYGARHFREQAIFYSPNVDDANRAAQDFNSYMGSSVMRLRGEAPRAFAYHSKSENADPILSAFEAGDIAVLFVVGMLQEGFNMPSLAIGFDCRFHRVWNDAKIARLIQKIGRLMRLNTGKGRSQYYYARDVTDYYDLMPLFPEDEPNGINAVPYKDEKQAGEVTARVLASADGATDHDAPEPWAGEDVTVGASVTEIVAVHQFSDAGEIDATPISQDTIKIVATPMFFAIDAYGHSVKQSFSFLSIVGGNSADQNKKVLLALPERSDRPNQKTALGMALTNYTRGKGIDVMFDCAIRGRFPHWWTNTALLNKRELLSLPLGSDRPNSKTSEIGRALLRYINYSSSSYDEVFDKAIHQRFPHWWLDTAALNKEKLLALPEGSDRPNHTIKIGAALTNYICKGHGSYDAVFAKNIRERFPHWWLDTAASNKEKLLALPEGSTRPKKKTKIGQLLQSYIGKGHGSYDAVFDKAIRERFPHWWLDTAASNKEKLLALPEGSDRPSQKTTKLGRALTNYTCRTTYDPDFNKAIRERFPHWFKK